MTTKQLVVSSREGTKQKAQNHLQIYTAPNCFVLWTSPWVRSHLSSEQTHADGSIASTQTESAPTEDCHPAARVFVSSCTGVPVSSNTDQNRFIHSKAVKRTKQKTNCPHASLLYIILCLDSLVLQNVRQNSHQQNVHMDDLTGPIKPHRLDAMHADTKRAAGEFYSL